MTHARANPFFTGLITAAVLLVVMGLIFMSGIPAGPQIPGPWNDKLRLHVQLADADALAPHASVEVAGVKIGEVQSVDAHGNLAVATLQVSPQYFDLRRNATVYLRAHGLFGPKYIAIVPGTSASPRLHDGDTVSVKQTVQPVDLDAILQDLQKPEQQQLRTFFVEFGQAAAGRGDDVNHLFAASNSLTRVLDSPVKALDQVGPQFSDMLVNDEAFNNYFAQSDKAPLDQLVANSEATWQAFANNSQALQQLLVHADSALTNLDTILNGEPSNLSTIIQTLGRPGGTIDQLNKFTYQLALFGSNLTGNERKLGSDPASINVTNDIIAAIKNVSSAFYYSDALNPAVCPTTPLVPGNDNHCSTAALLASQGIGDGRAHYLHVDLFHFSPPAPNMTQSGLPGAASVGWEGSDVAGFGSLFAS